MSAIMNGLGTILGYVMYFCYHILGNYALAILLFTLLTKVILLPVAIWVQNNGIKIVHLTPELNRIKANHFGDKDRIAEETQKLYKREKYNAFANLIPTFVQLVLLIGLIQVIYHPLNHIFHADGTLIDAMVQLTGQLTGCDVDSGSVQLTVVQAIQTGQYTDAFQALPGMTADLMTRIQALDLNLFGLNLGDVPITAGGATLLVPILAGLAAFTLCLSQNKMNPLQAEQGMAGQLSTTILSVGIALFLGFFVPAGVGLYWIFSNLFTILQQFLLNIIIDPKKHIDYEALEESKKALAELDNLGGKKKLFARDPNAKREKADYKRFFSIVNKHIVFYSEKSGFYKYFQDTIEYLLKHSNVTIHYITSDPDDQVFALAEKEPRIKPYYIGEKRLITLMMKMEADIVCMTMPDIETFHIKRSYIKKDIEYVYLFHGFASTHMVLRETAFDHYDTIFCSGPVQMKEIRAREALKGLPPKRLIDTGYGVIEHLRAAYEQMEQVPHDRPQILIAPSWQKDNILESCIDPLLRQLLAEERYNVIVRPHPEWIKRFPQKQEAFEQRHQAELAAGKFEFQTDFSSGDTVYQSDLVITDWSSIAMEFSFTTCKPSLFINTPMKVMNPNYRELNLEPLDLSLRDQLGRSVELDAVGSTAGQAVADLLADAEGYRERIGKLVCELMPNFGHSGEIGGKYLLHSLQEKITNRKDD